ncbi:isoleucine--tRNA ligase [Acidisphaera sp. L21]|uniref:isoleucine--tRNA ligase n=1 Tax=Acidisphaera sp. L21 TaxID=1641851 RepID=UPI00131DA44F|nr:isoleucine--tRNA ligase [Acidisphaera sp. L21]
MIDYRDTVFLPTTSFPMRGDLPKREPEILARWERMGLWQRTRAMAAGKPTFVLHDGPIYSNGNLHIGHALNRILKDVIMRAHRMAGFDADFIPGWDTHGLPIEWKVEEEYRRTGRDKDAVPVLDFRAECRAYSQGWLDIQTAEFQRLGVTGDWAGRYATMDFPAEAAIAGEIGKFLLNGSLYRGLRPVMWSTVEKTALAEAEIEYHDHTSDTVWVRFPILTGSLAGTSVVIWTTTPWTMPGNRALAAGAAIDYAQVRVDSVAEGSLAKPGEIILVALDLVGSVCTQLGIATHHVLQVVHGSDLDGLICAHPLRGQGYDHDAPILMGDFVTTEQGSGLVHMAPAHGEEDFGLCRAHGIAVPETVGEDGRYTPGVPMFAGTHVFKAATPVGAAIEAAGGLIGRGKLVHSYPHSWRSKAPLIYRATPQWFIRMDGPEQIRARALEAIEATPFIPPQGRNRIGSMVAGRPDWCISRQRAWGVPIPVFVDRTTGEPLRDPAVVARVVEAFTSEGADAWYRSPKSRFLGDGRDPENFEQVMDIVDVWFESGSTHGFALEDRGKPWPADLYLEGSDQHRGWFQSSLLEAIGTRGAAPFKAVLTHGFVLDETGRKMSKSLGNVTAPQQVTDKLGADILRLWVMNSDTTEDLRIGPEILKQQAELYRRLRNTLRWLLGAVEGFTEAERVPVTEMPELERWVLHRLSEIDGRLRRALQTHDWTGLYPELHAFCAADLSAFYFDVRKDALYCDRPDDAKRRATRTVLNAVHRCLTIWLAPVLVFTAEEAWGARFPGEDDSVHLQPLPEIPAEWYDSALAARIATLREHRGEVTTVLETARRDGTIKASLQAVVSLPESMRSLLDDPAWCEFAIVSQVVPGGALAVDKAPGEKCARCWKVLPEVGSNPAHPALCLRCTDAVESGLVGQPRIDAA